MEITKKGQFITDFYGSASAVGAEKVLKKWVEDKTCAWLLSWGEQIKRRGQNAMSALEEVLSVFHRDSEGYPILGNWMLRKCLISTGEAIFNTQKNKAHPKKSIIPMAIQLVEPININIYNGSLITVPNFVKTYTVTTKQRSFFKAYEGINAGAIFDIKLYIDEELLSPEHIGMLLDKAGAIGVGAFRERFGKFKWLV